MRATKIVSNQTEQQQQKQGEHKYKRGENIKVLDFIFSSFPNFNPVVSRPTTTMYACTNTFTIFADFGR